VSEIERKLAAIFAADVEGYSRLMGLDEVGTLRTLTAHREIIDKLIEQHRGRVFNSAGDSVLAEFASVVDAVQCAVEVQQALSTENDKKSSHQQMRFRIGVHVGDVLVKGGNLFGDGVNIAARLETLAEAGGICVSGAVRDHIGTRLPVNFENLGEQAVKNIKQPLHCFRINPPAASETALNKRPLLPMPDKPSIAVLPFTNMSGDPEQEFFADGIVEDVITGLSRFRWLFVIARNSSFTYKGRAVDVKHVGRELGVRYVVEGSVRTAGNRVRVTAQLIEADTGLHIWADRYDRAIEDVFTLQDEITDTIVATLEPEISASERERARRKAPEHIGAWEHYQRGMWHLLRRNREELPASQACFRAAIDLDSNFAAAHAGLAVSYFFVITHGFTESPEGPLRGLLEEAALAVSLDPRDALAHSALGIGYMESGELAKALSEHEAALSLNPNSSFGHFAIAYAYERAGKFNDAVEHLSTALRLSPKDPAAWSYLTLKASSLYQLGRYEEAVFCARDATRFPVVDMLWPLLHLTAALGQLNRKDEANTALVLLCKRWPGLTVSKYRLWPHVTADDAKVMEHVVEGLRKAGMPE
jgi:adenylate cyclase